MHFAHSRPPADPRPWQLLSTHLAEVGELAAEFAPTELAAFARTAGRWHDAGKYQSAFQSYIGVRPDLSPQSGEVSLTGVPHAAAGAALALDLLGENTLSGMYLALVIEAHHGALKAPRDLTQAVERRGTALLREARAGGMPAAMEQEDPASALPPSAMAIRMLFSALIDADLLNTEAWDRGTSRPGRGEPLVTLRDRLDAFCKEKMDGSAALAITEKEQALHMMRKQVFDACIAAATEPRQTFTLTVPTGGGKTLSGLAFALHHAAHHGMRRVIVVAPYTSILEQTAQVYRDALGADNVVEHHSNLIASEDTDRNRQACENWDAPIIVTTSVQLLESLHAAHKRPCRKLHRLCDSVVLLDEVQTFPADLLGPIHAALKRLVDDFGVTVVHGTATQPLLATATGGKKTKLAFPAREIIPDPSLHFNAVRGRFRLEVFGDLDMPAALEDLAAHAAKQPQALLITHLREEARQLADLLGDDSLHLSAAMCAEHRTSVLQDARRRLQAGEPCLLVATQLIEAGVDIDFPVVYRAMAGLETLAQAAGRCNRGMHLDEPGRFIVFRSPSNPPPGTPKLGMQTGLTFFKREIPDLSDPALFPAYMSRLLDITDIDANGILQAEKEMDFPAVAERFRMIDEPTISVVAPYGDAPELVKDLRSRGPSRDRFRALQRLTVSLREAAFRALYRGGWLEPALPGGDARQPLETLWVVRDGDDMEIYDKRFGFPAGEKDTKLKTLTESSLLGTSAATYGCLTLVLPKVSQCNRKRSMCASPAHSHALHGLSFPWSESPMTSSHRRLRVVFWRPCCGSRPSDGRCGALCCCSRFGGCSSGVTR